jgi:hypothetical protein
MMRRGESKQDGAICSRNREGDDGEGVEEEEGLGGLRKM